MHLCGKYKYFPMPRYNNSDTGIEMYNTMFLESMK